MVNENINFKVDETKCVKCGLCTKDCVANIIKMDEFPKIDNKGMPCLECEHCLAICPTGAISIIGDTVNDVASSNNFDIKPEELKNMVFARRSIRQYKNESVDRKIIEDLCETAMYAPTARNAMNTLLTVIDDKAIMNDFRDKVYDKFCQLKFDDAESGAFFALVAKKWKEDKYDKLFAGAPHLIVASAPEESINIASDPVIILSYFELLAVSNGLGTLWDGMLTFILNVVLPEFKDYLKIPRNHKVGYAMVFGNPAVKYTRGVKRNINNINYVK